MIHWINPFLKKPSDNHVHSRKIDPIKVIEEWSLCHHLACVVKYLARTGVEREPLLSLMRAEWYLNRELERIEMGIGSCFLCPMEDCSIPLDKILVDWKLVPHLGNAHAYILRARLSARATIPYQQNKIMELFAYQIPLSKALKYLRLEIFEQKKGASL